MNTKQKKAFIWQTTFGATILAIFLEILTITAFGRSFYHLIWMSVLDFLLAWASSSIYFGCTRELVPKDSLMLQDNKIMRLFEEDTWLKASEYWKVHDEGRYFRSYKENSYVKIPSGIKIILGTAPVRLREISYEAIIARKDTPEGFVDAEALIQGLKEKGIKNLQELGTYVCNEFNEKKAPEIAKFYNPEDPKQLSEFQHLLNGFLKEILGKDNPFWIGRGTVFKV